MKKFKYVISCLCLSLLMSGCVDQKQASKTSEKDRIVVTSVAITEILDTLKIDNVVGIPSSESYELPERYNNVKKVGAPMNPDMEIVKELNPTIILSPNSLEGDLASKYEKIKVNAGFLNLKSTAGMFQSIRDLGKMFDKEKEAKAMVKDFEDYMKTYRETHENEEAPTVLILMGLPGSYVIATENSYAGSLVKLAGGVNVYGDEKNDDFLNVNTEDIVQKDPDIILRTAHALPEQVKTMFEEEFVENDIWKHFRAVKEGSVFDLDAKKFGMSANLKYQEALEDLEAIFYKK